MATGTADQPAELTYGARPVSVDIARGRPLIESSARTSAPEAIRTTRLSLTHQMVADRLSLAHWPRGHQIIICGLAGGTGRTTVAGLLATVLAELPYAHIWHPIALVDSGPRSFSSTRRRWDVVDQPDPAFGPPIGRSCTQSGVWTLTGVPSRQHRRDFSALVVDGPAGLPSDLAAVVEDPASSIVLMTRPDRMSLSDAADALVWMNDQSLMARDRVTVVVNHGVDLPDQGSRAAATALGIRCAAIHNLPAESTLAPGRALPSGRDLPVQLRRRLARICLDAWSQTQPSTPSAAPSSHSLLEHA